MSAIDDLRARLAANRVGLDWNGETDALSKCDAIAADAIAEIERLEWVAERANATIHMLTENNNGLMQRIAAFEAARQWQTGNPPEERDWNTTVSNGSAVFVRSLWWHKTYGCWMQEGVDVKALYGWTILAYMPLPKPWKEGE